jgi:hypothetical protein
MIDVGKLVKSDSGRRIRVDGLIRAGGQGEAHWATDMTTGEKGVLKVFFKCFANGDTVKRLRFLVEQDLAAACPALRSPCDLLSQEGFLGHYAPLAPGRPMEEFLEHPDNTFIEGLQLAGVLAHAVAVLHGRHIAHGDLRAENLIVNRAGGVFELYVIDLDNFNAPGMPAPPMVGQSLYMAPELRGDLGQATPRVPDLWTDRFSLGMLMHEITVLKHPAAGADDNEADFNRAMSSGRWAQDPAAADRPKSKVGGYPVEILSADLARLFRSAVSLNRDERPSPDDWESALAIATNSVYLCPSCGGPCVIDASKAVCPLCRTPYPTLELTAPNGVRVRLDSGAVVVGRNVFPAAIKVSARHVVFRKVGPHTWLESLGRNGSYRWNGSDWIRLPDGKPILVQKGDRLRFADLELLVS